MKAKEMRCSLSKFRNVKPFAKECFGCQNGIQEWFQKENRKKVIEIESATFEVRNHP